MKKMEKISNFIDPTKRKMCSIFFYVCIVCYFIFTVLLIKDILNGEVPFGGTDLFSGIRNYLMLVIAVAIIHIWMYISDKKGGTFALLAPTRFFTGCPKYEEIYEDILHWEKVYILWKRSPKEIFLKLLYFVSWVGLGALVCFCIDKLGYYQFSTIWGSVSDAPALAFCWLTVCELLFISGFVLNCFSCFSSLTFCYFIRELSNNSKKLPFRQKRPSSTTEFQILCYLASRVSISFFVVSMLYILLLLACIALGNPITAENVVFFYILILSVILPCVVCLIVVFILPKVFLNRLLRRWKQESAKNLDKLDDSGGSPELEDADVIQLTREHIWADKLTLMKTEIVIGFLALIVDITSLMLCMVQTF